MGQGNSNWSETHAMQQAKKRIPLRIRLWRPRLIALGRRLRAGRQRLPTVQLSAITGRSGAYRFSEPIQDDISMPPFVSSSLDDFNALMTLADWIQPQIVLELGTAFGNTVANICRLLPAVHVYTVNAPFEQQSGVLTTFDLDEQEIGRVYRKYGYTDRVTQILENTLDLDLSEFLSAPVIDLAIIDACHDTEFVINDFHKIRPFVRTGGVVLFHDTHPSMERHYHTSYRACLQLRRQGYDIFHVNGTSWAIWFKGRPDKRANASIVADE